jgi:Teichoic acid biosynthesis proteins
LTEILGYTIFSGSKAELVSSITNSNKKLNIVSGNPEVLFNALNDTALYASFKSDSSIIIPDGAGVVLTSRFVNSPVTEKIAGIELMEEIIRYCSENDKGVFLLGAEQSSLESCRNKLLEKYPKLRISGIMNGFFDIENCTQLIEEINSSDSYALFVAMGSPRQEKFIINI